MTSQAPVRDTAKLIGLTLLQRNVEKTLGNSLSLGPHCAVFRMRKLKSQVAKVSTVRVEKIFALAAQHSHRNCKSHLSSSPN